MSALKTLQFIPAQERRFQLHLQHGKAGIQGGHLSSGTFVKFRIGEAGMQLFLLLLDIGLKWWLAPIWREWLHALLGASAGLEAGGQV